MDSIKSALDIVAADKGRIYSSLNYIRTAISKQPNKKDELQGHGGIKIIVKCLNQVNPKVLSLALSILADCSINEGCRIELLKYDVIKNLCFIMKNINVDSINNRTCRMIANLTASQNSIPVIYRYNIPSIIVRLLSNTKCDTVTKYSAIRALRKIWENSSCNGCKEMLNCKAIKVVTKFLTAKNKDIVSAVLQAQVSFLTNPAYAKNYSNHSAVIFQILGILPSEQMHTINTFVFLLPDQKLVSKVIYLMCRNNTVRAELANTCLINHIIEFLKKGSNHYLIQAMCHLLKCPHNRLRFSRLEHGINIFMDLLCNNDPIPKKLALHTLVYFQYSSILLKALIKKNLIPLLIKDLSLYVKSHKILHGHEDKLRVQSFNTDSSPSICTSPARTSSMSPTTSNKTTCSPLKDDNITTNTYSPDYSPVCESFDTESLNADESKSDISDIIEDEICVELPNALANTTRGGIIIESLTNIIYVQNIGEMLASKDVWETIFDYLQYIRDDDVNLNAIKILQRITCEVQNFEGILIDGFILSIHQRMCRPIHHLNKCNTCAFRNEIGMKIIANASNTFQSKFAETMMISKMIEPNTSDTNQQLKTLISITTPLVIQTRPKQLIEMLCRYKVYINLCNIILDDQNPSFGDAVGAIMSLFKTLKFIYKKPQYEYCINDRKCGNSVFPKETTVTLVMDDGTLINANKSFLSLKSPMFEAMFRCGGFKEAYENTIHLNDVTSECFKCLLRLLDDYCECKLPTNINVFLELIVITDKYMLNELFEQIYPAFMKYMTVENCSIIYAWVKEIGYRLQITPSADFEVIKYLLHSNSRFSDRVKAIQTISRNDYGQRFIDDLSIILKPGLECSIYGDHNATSSLFYLSHFPNSLETLKMI